MLQNTSVKNICLFLSFWLVGFCIFKALTNSAHIKSSARSTAIIDCHRAELSLRFADSINVLQFIAQSSYGEKKNDGESAQEFTGMLKSGKAGLLATAAQDILNRATQEDKESPIALARKIILASELGESVTDDLNQLVLLCSDSKDDHLSESLKLLPPAFQSIYDLRPHISNIELANQAIEKNFKSGWFKERALLKLYKGSGQSQKYSHLLEAIKHTTWKFLLKLICLTCGLIILMIAGLFIIIWQLCFYKPCNGLTNSVKNYYNKDSIVDVKYNWRTVLLVFYAWFCIQILFGLFVAWLKKINIVDLTAVQHPVVLAAFVTITYLLSNGPILLYLYFVVFKPRKIAFLQGVNFRLKDGPRGLLKAFGIAFLAWAAAIPIVIFSVFLSVKLFNSTGSSNPVIGLIMQTAGAGNLASILLFYLTLGVLAPFVEESLFRGFFYDFLRSHYGPLFSNILSAGLFAAVHMDPGAVLPLFCLGSVLAYLFEITGSTVPSIIAHGLWNSGTFTLVLLLFGT